MDVWEEISHFVVNLRLEQLPAHVVHHAKLVLLDTVGTMLGGSQSEPMQKWVLSSERYTVKGNATVIGYPVSLEPGDAALMNGTSAVALEMDEGNQFAKGHPAAHIIPAVLAWAEHMLLNGKQILESLIVGYELAARAGVSTNLRPDVHPHGTWGTIGAAVAVAKLRDFNHEQLVNTIHLAASMSIASAWSTALEGATVRNIYTGLSNHLGILATGLALAGFNAGLEIFQNVYGHILSNRFDLGIFAENLGHEYAIMNNYFKIHSCCRYNHAAIDALQSIIGVHSINYEHIKKIEVETYSAAAQLGNQNPRNTLAARFSIPFALATYIVNGNTGTESFSEDALANSQIRKLAQRVVVRENPDFSAMLPELRPARVIIYLQDGQQVSNTFFSSRGGYDNPYQESLIVDKFRKLAGEVVGDESAARFINLCSHLEKINDIRKLMESLKLKTS